MHCMQGALTLLLAASLFLLDATRIELKSLRIELKSLRIELKSLRIELKSLTDDCFSQFVSQVYECFRFLKMSIRLF
jgi:hypothetical protein